HATSAQSPPRSEDFLHLNDMRADFCRPTNETLAAFEARANEALRQIAAQEGTALIDTAAEVSGHREFFGDLVHFTDAGAARMAGVLAEGIMKNTAADPVGNRRDRDAYGVADPQTP